MGFFVEGVRPLEHALMPTLALALRVINSTPEPVHSMLLRCQLQIEPQRRAYSAAQRTALAGLFAEPERWGETLRPLLWQQVTTMIGGFTGTTVAEVQLPCSFDFALAATQYLEALGGEGDIPLRLVFSGTVFYAGPSGVQAAPIAWDLEASYRFPARLWRDCLAAAYGEGAWVRLPRTLFDQLQQYRKTHGLGNLEAAIDSLLAASPQQLVGVA